MLRVGGFIANIANNSEQKWFIKSNEENKVIRIRKRKDGHWYDKWDNRYALTDRPRKFYDYNF